MLYCGCRAVKPHFARRLLSEELIEMPVVIDYRHCDGVEDCPAVRICDANALYFDPATRRVEYDQDKCRNCGTCAHYCGLGAVMHVATDAERQELETLLQQG